MNHLESNAAQSVGQRKLISIVIPVYNEEKNIPLIYGEMEKVWPLLDNDYDYEIIFVNDGSQDGSGEIMEKLASVNRKIKYIEFSRNFGKEIATSAGLHHANGDAAIIIDADLQHPPELIPEFIQKWREGADVVIGVREKNQGEGLVKKAGSYLFYKVMGLIGETKIVPRSTDYRLIDKQVIQEFRRFTERNRITRGLLEWLGFKRAYIYFSANGRKFGERRYSYLKLIKLAFSSVTTHSLFPLKLAGYLGVIITFFSGFLGLFIFIEKYILGDVWRLNFSGPAILAVINLFLVGIILICLGFVALYIANIHGEVINRPMYVIRKKKNFKE